MIIFIIIIYNNNNSENFINNNAVFTMYHAEWCPHCKAALPDFKNVIKNNKNNNIKCKEVEQEDPEFNSLDPKIKDLIEGFPTYIYSKGKMNEVYTGDRDETSILNFLKKKN